MVISYVYNIAPDGTEVLSYRSNYSYANGVLRGIQKLSASVSTTSAYQVDRMGNPVEYTSGGKTYHLNWGEGRMLTSIGTDENNITSYTYNADGLRTSKTVTTNGESTTTQYIWGSNGLTGMVSGDTTVIVLYDVDGEPAGFSVNGTVYTYVKNIQGDVMQILDTTGDTVVSYTYDPWGVPTVTGNTTLAAINPCSYRGYDYDEETGYYYLQSRYYDPEVGRFLNMDDIAFLGISGTMMGNNLFLYCDNDPIDAMDSSGYWYFEMSVGVAGGILDVCLWALASALMYKFGTLKWLSKISKAVKKAWKTLIDALAKVIVNSVNWIARKLFAGYRPTAAFLNYTWRKLASLLDTYLTVSVGYALAMIIDRNDSDGFSGYLRW